MVDKIPKADYRGFLMEKWPPIPAKFLKAYENGVSRIAGGNYSNREKAEGHRWLHYLLCDHSGFAPRREGQDENKKEKKVVKRKK